MPSRQLVVPAMAPGAAALSGLLFDREWRPKEAPQTEAPRTGVDAAFVDLLQRYRASGGLARKREMAEALERRHDHRAGFLDMCIERRQVFAFDWQSITWLPRFQFPFAGPSPLPSMTLVMEHIDPSLDSWGCAWWFASPHPLLDGRAPVDAISQDFRAVIRAARAHRDPGAVVAL